MGTHFANPRLKCLLYQLNITIVNLILNFVDLLGSFMTESCTVIVFATPVTVLPKSRAFFWFVYQSTLRLIVTITAPTVLPCWCDIMSFRFNPPLVNCMHTGFSSTGRWLCLLYIL